jgi:hypothetical protein
MNALPFSSLVERKLTFPYEYTGGGNVSIPTKPTSYKSGAQFLLIQFPAPLSSSPLSYVPGITGAFCSLQD